MTPPLPPVLCCAVLRPRPQICDFLAQQGAGKYVSESQVKTVLGFTGSTAAHRQWRR